jgi:hypothetical protein
MTKQPRFSQRYETRRPEEGLIYEQVPARLRQGLLNIINLTPGGLSAPLNVQLHLALDRAIPDVPNYHVEIHLRRLIEDLDWDELCDACEVIYRAISEPHRGRFSNELNQLFARRYFGYELRDGRVERVGARVQEAAIAEARGILRDPDLSGPDEQYQKAIGFFNRRPEPDCENCVKEAASAVEGVARVLLNDHSLTLSTALKRLQKEKDVHPSLVYLIDKLYAYRGDAEGVGHALTQKKEVRIEEAEFALGVSASAIVYLARLFARGVE